MSTGNQRSGEFISADVGGTHARVGLVRAGGPGEPAVVVLAHRKYACADYPSLAAIIGEFRAAEGAGALDRAVLACAGVVLDGHVLNANLAWRVDLPTLRGELALRELACINDFQAAAHAAQCMEPARTVLLTPGIESAAPGPVLVLGPGTGLGAALRIPYNGGTVVVPTEAGHIAFAPGTAREIEILRQLQKRARHVPTEHVISGPGLTNIHAALCAIDARPSAVLAPAAIAASARAGDAHAREAVLTFCGLLGSFIGDLCVLSGATQVFVAGGVLPQLRDFLAASDFHERLLDKGSMRPMLEQMPVRLIEEEQLGVIGAAAWQMQRQQQ